VVRNPPNEAVEKLCDPVEPRFSQSDLFENQQLADSKKGEIRITSSGF
jgi:hypothetical protein